MQRKSWKHKLKVSVPGCCRSCKPFQRLSFAGRLFPVWVHLSAHSAWRGRRRKKWERWDRRRGCQAPCTSSLPPSKDLDVPHCESISHVYCPAQKPFTRFSGISQWISSLPLQFTTKGEAHSIRTIKTAVSFQLITVNMLQLIMKASIWIPGVAPVQPWR